MTIYTYKIDWTDYNNVRRTTTVGTTGTSVDAIKQLRAKVDLDKIDRMVGKANEGLDTLKLIHSIDLVA